jgi:hypothetical protein
MSEKGVVAVKGLEMEFLGAFKRGLQALEDAGKLLVQLLEKDPEARDRLVQEYGFDHGTLNTLEKIGTGRLYAKLAAFGTRYSAMPMSEQKRIADGMVDALVVKPDGSTDVMKVAVLRAPAEMRDQLLNHDHVRTLDEQRVWLMRRQKGTIKTEGAEKAVAMPWRVVGNRIEIIEAMKVNRADLLTMLRALEG